MNALIKIKAHIIEIGEKSIFDKPVDKILANGSMRDKKKKTPRIKKSNINTDKKEVNFLN